MNAPPDTLLEEIVNAHSMMINARSQLSRAGSHGHLPEPAEAQGSTSDQSRALDLRQQRSLAAATRAGRCDMTRAVDDFKLDIHAVWHDAGIMKRCRRPLEEKRKTPRAFAV